MNLVTKLERMWNQERKYVTRYMLVFSGSVFVHAILAMLFLQNGRPVLAGINFASLVFYLGWICAFANRKVNDFMLLLLYLDVVIHACIYNVLLGRQTGFYLYTFTIIPVTFFMSSRDLKHKHTMLVSAILSMASIFLMLMTLLKAPTAPLESEAVSTQFFQINVLMCAMLLSLYTSEFMTETLNTQDSLSFHAENDPLTGLRNRFGFVKEIERIHGTQYCVIMADIDNFKQVNDTYGHATGDIVLSKIGKVLLNSVRKEDIVCRWGGEEFVIIVRSDLDAACAAVERIRRRLSTVAVENGEHAPFGVTMTFGIADCMEAGSFEELIAIADKNLLRGKRSGKNCMVLSGEVTGIVSNAVQEEATELDTTHLTGRVFSAFSATSDTTYIYMMNMQTNVSRWSRAAVEYFGLPGEYMYDAGNIWMGFVHPDDREMYAKDVEAVLSGRKHFHDVTYRARNRNGDYVRLVCKGVVTPGDVSNPALFAGTITNLGLTDSTGALR